MVGTEMKEYIFPNDITFECFGPLLAPNVLDCSVCQFSHLYPLPDPAAVDRYYEGDYFYSGSDPHSPSDWFEKERHEYEAGLWDSYFSYLASFLEKGKPIVDVGAGCGWFIGWLYERGDYNKVGIVGIEPSKQARDFSPYRGLFHPNLDILKAYRPSNIVLMLTLEHILDPESFLREQIVPYLGGRLIVVVPREFSLLQQFVGLRYPDKRHWFVSQVHCNYFTKTSLKSLLERVGLSVTHTGATFPTEIWPLIGRNHIGNDEQGRRNHLWRLQLERRWPGVFKVYGWLGRWLGIGREIVMVGEKQ